jgi:hypothetical protein
MQSQIPDLTNKVLISKESLAYGLLKITGSLARKRFCDFFIPFFKSNDRDGYAWCISILSKYPDDILGARGAPLPLAK